MKNLTGLATNPHTWHTISLGLLALTVFFPHAAALAEIAKAVGMAADHGDAAGAGMALLTGGASWGLHHFERKQADSNAKPQTAATPN